MNINATCSDTTRVRLCYTTKAHPRQITVTHCSAADALYFVSCIAPTLAWFDIEATP